MKAIIFIFNLPWTILGIILALISIPIKITINQIPFALIFKIRSFWWFQWLPNSKGTRGMAIGNVVLLGPKELPKDREHELIHTEQIEREPFIHIFLYYIEMIKHGYKDNKYEKEAYSRAGNLYIQGQINRSANVVTSCLKLISTDKRVVIGATNGTEILASASDVFSYISPDFKNWGCDKVELGTPEVVVEVYEQIEDAEYPAIFGSIDQNFDLLVLTTPQIKSFIVNNAKDYLLEAEWTCFRFLFKVGDEFFVADVRVLSDGNRDIRATRFLDGSVRHAKYRHRIVVPQRTAN